MSERESSPPGADAAPESEHDRDAKAAPGGVLALLRRSQSLQTLLAAVVAWLATLAPVAYVRGAPPLASVFATLAVMAGAAGPLLVEKRPQVARHVGVSLYLALAVATWLAAQTLLLPARLDPLLGLLGAIAWGIFALAWSDRWNIPTPKDPPKSVIGLPARATLPRTALPIATVSVLGGLGLLAFGWMVRDDKRALVGQTAALACAVAVLTAGSVLATARAKPGRTQAGLSKHALRALAALVLVIATGLFAIFIK